MNGQCYGAEHNSISLVLGWGKSAIKEIRFRSIACETAAVDKRFQ